MLKVIQKIFKIIQLMIKGLLFPFLMIAIALMKIIDRINEEDNKYIVSAFYLIIASVIVFNTAKTEIVYRTKVNTVANIRSCGSKNCKVIDKIRNYEKITILEKTNDFSKIEYKNSDYKKKKGYIHNSLYEERNEYWDPTSVLIFQSAILAFILFLFSFIFKFLLKLLFFYHFKKEKREYVVTFELKFRYEDEDKDEITTKTKFIDIKDCEIYVNEEYMKKKLNNLYKLGTIEQRYSHSTYHKKNEPIYREEEYTVFERKNVYENGRYHYVNVPVNKTKKVFSHYEEREIEDRHYDAVRIRGEVLRIISIKSNLFAKIINIISGDKSSIIIEDIISNTIDEVNEEKNKKKE